MLLSAILEANSKDFDAPILPDEYGFLNINTIHLIFNAI